MKRPAFDVIFEEKKWPLTITKLRSKTKKTSKPVLIDSDIGNLDAIRINDVLGV